MTFEKRTQSFGNEKIFTSALKLSIDMNDRTRSQPLDSTMVGAVTHIGTPHR